MSRSSNFILMRFSPRPVGMNAISPARTCSRKVFVDMSSLAAA